MRLIPKTALGIGTKAPQAVLHLHQPKLDMSCAPAPDTDDSKLPVKLLQLTTYMATNGLNVSYNNNEITFKQQEEAKFSLEGPGGGLTIAPDGNVGVGTTNPQAKLDVAGSFKAQSAKINGLLCAKEVRVQLSGSPCWPDYVFNRDYNLLPLQELEQFVTENKHLPDVPSATEVEANGVNIGEMNALLLQKVEELTLYIIQMEKRLSELEGKKVMIND